MTTSETQVWTEIASLTLVINIDRPEARNAIDAAAARGIATTIDELIHSEGFAEGVCAFSEKRAPQWAGKSALTRR